MVRDIAARHLRIEQRNRPTREFDALWAHLVDTDGRGYEGWLRIDTPYVLEPHTGDYAASLVKLWNDRLRDESRAASAIRLAGAVGARGSAAANRRYAAARIRFIASR